MNKSFLKLTVTKDSFLGHTISKDYSITKQTSKEFEPDSSIILEQLVLVSDSLWEDTEGKINSTFASFSSRFLCLISSLTLFLFTSSRKGSIVLSSEDFELAGTVSFATMESGISADFLEEKSFHGCLESYLFYRLLRI
ncbi:unnamed protein product [Rhizophagus irregularis]|uniref:Uncharacterized protein n=1 Tax=Rhizophagus irregularis TaxID=588596 RepID=A0A915Z5D0_9GLOM|nr:unnamed protein product [Rhizophagus irregularis]